MHPGAVVAEAVVNAGRWLCNVVAGFSPGPDFVLINIAEGYRSNVSTPGLARLAATPL
jgi:hypothetical protein